MVAIVDEIDNANNKLEHKRLVTTLIRRVTGIPHSAHGAAVSVMALPHLRHNVRCPQLLP